MLRGQRRPGQTWTDEDALLLQALTYYESQTCSGCGHPMWESMDPANEGRYTTQPPVRCHACTAVAVAVKPYEDAAEKGTLTAPGALRFSAELRPAQ